MNGNDVLVDEQGRVRARYPRVDGRRSGTSEEFREDGRVYKRAEYKNGVRHGVSIQWHANGNILARAVYRDNKLIERVDRYPDGTIAMVDTEFESTEYYHNGQRKYHSVVENGLYVLQETWDSNGVAGEQSEDPPWDNTDEPDSATVGDLEETTCSWEHEDAASS